jgi:DNA-binding protein HU-beta
MNRAELIEALAERAELTKAQTARMLDAVLEVITATIAAGEQVALIGFGTFKRALRAAREGRNPATGAQRSRSLRQSCRSSPQVPL